MNKLPLLLIVCLLTATAYRLEPAKYVETTLYCGGQPHQVFKNTKLFSNDYVTMEGVSFTKLPNYCKESQ